MGLASVRSHIGSFENRMGRILFPRDQVGKKVMRVPHFPKGAPRGGERHMEKSLPHAWKVFQIKQIQSMFPSKSDIEKVELRIKSGECRDTDTVERALEIGMKVVLLCGNKMANKQVRDKYVELKSIGHRLRLDLNTVLWF